MCKRRDGSEESCSDNRWRFLPEKTRDRIGASGEGRPGPALGGLAISAGTRCIPRVHGLMSEMTFEELELPIGPMPASAEELLARYFQVKIESLQFFGATNFRRSLFDGFESLVLTFPAILWLARNFSRTMPHAEAITLALQIVDDNFGFNPWLGSCANSLPCEPCPVVVK